MLRHGLEELSQDVIVVKLHNMELDGSPDVDKIGGMGDEGKYPFWEEGRRLRWLRQAERIPSGAAFAKKLNWPQSAVSQFETGMRRVPADKALQLSKVIPGFNPMWLWQGDKAALSSFDLRTRIEAEEAKEAEGSSASMRER